MGQVLHRVRPCSRRGARTLTGSSTTDVSGAREADPVREGTEAATRDLASHLRFWIVAGVVVWLDLWSKHGVFAALASTETWAIIPGTIEFRRSLNDGAVFGSFTGFTDLFIVASLFALGFVLYLFVHSARTQRTLHLALGLILAGALGNLYDRAFVMADVLNHHPASGRQEKLIGLVTSDPSDRFIRIGDWPDGANPRSFVRADVTVHRQGVVRDFIKLVPKFPAGVPKLAGRDIWPWVFNVADAALVCGVGLLLLNTWITRNPHADPQ